MSKNFRQGGEDLPSEEDFLLTDEQIKLMVDVMEKRESIFRELGYVHRTEEASHEYLKENEMRD
jgi:hypothetical protein